ncbi:DUF1240 domain-containing protein, partial [Yersinia pestis]
MKNRLFNALLGVMLLLIITPMMLLVGSYVISLMRMEDEITFSSSIFISLLSSPLVFYALAGSTCEFIFN